VGESLPHPLRTRHAARAGRTGSTRAMLGSTKGQHMYIGGSLFLLAVGAIMAFAVSDVIDGVDLYTAGLILMGVGVLGLLLSLFMSMTRGRDREVRDTRDPRV